MGKAEQQALPGLLPACVFMLTADWISRDCTVASSRSLLAGRDRELTFPRTCLTQAIASHGQLALESGEAGIGNTRWDL